MEDIRQRTPKQGRTQDLTARARHKSHHRQNQETQQDQTPRSGRIREGVAAATWRLSGGRGRRSGARFGPAALDDGIGTILSGKDGEGARSTRFPGFPLVRRVPISRPTGAWPSLSYQDVGVCGTSMQHIAEEEASFGESWVEGKGVTAQSPAGITQTPGWPIKASGVSERLLTLCTFFR